MKFIRDIILEKARLSAERAEGLSAPAQNSFQPPIMKQQPDLETDLVSVETLLSSLDLSETTPDTAEQPIDANDISRDASLSAKKPVLGDEQPVMTLQPEIKPENASDAEASPYFDAMKALDAFAEESADQHSGQHSPRPDALDPSEISALEPHAETDVSGLRTPTRADDIEVPSIVEKGNRDPLEQLLQSEEGKRSPTPDTTQTRLRPELANPNLDRLQDTSTLKAYVLPAHDSLNGASTISPEVPEPVSAQIERSHIPKIDQANTEPGPPEAVSVPAPAVGRGAARAGRVKTRLLGFNPGSNPAPDPFDKSTRQSSGGYTQFPVGWLIVVDGHGVGSAFTLFDGVSQIGRSSDQTVCLDFGDNSISRENHAVVAYDSETRKFFLGHGGKSNLVRLNNRPVLSTEEIESGNTIRIGETTLRFVGLCGGDFQWQETPREVRQNAAFS